MNNLEPTVDMRWLAFKLHQQPDVTAGIKKRIKDMFTPPVTMEDVDSLIVAITEPATIAPRISIPTLERGIQKARFYVNKEELDYV